MKLKKSFFILSILIAVSISLLSLKSGDQGSWEQFRGNNRNGASIETNINEEWLSNSPELVWKKSIGSGFSELLVSNGKVFTMTGEKTDSLKGLEFMVAYDAKTSEEVWKTYVDSMMIEPDGSGDGPRPTPAIDEKAIYCLSSHGKLRALSLDDGEILWTVDFLKKFDNKPGWNYTTSPILYNDGLFIEVGGTESRGFASFDKDTGEVLWVNGEGRPSYCSPTIAAIDGGIHVIFANGTQLMSFDKTGNELWSYSMPIQSPTATPLFIAPNKIFMSSNAGCFMIKIENNEATEVFDSKSMRNTFSTSCYFNDHIYGISRGGALKCISASDGESKWSQRGFGLGSLIRVGNKLLALSDKGVVKLVEAVPEAYTEKVSFQAIEGKSYTAPSFANGKLYLRNLTEMVSYKLVY
ncbi:MAG: PQQ-binding-like beta-propeller repeat protein [Bacteroidetes bacterium]|nr:PQQ-binding-like beta-propeller repeat protein [Bacteroidota bacterium]